MHQKWLPLPEPTFRVRSFCLFYRLYLDISFCFAFNFRCFPNRSFGFSLIINFANIFLLVMDKWIPSQQQKSGLISRSFEFFNNELAELQEELDCPDEFICEFLEVVKKRWLPDSCYSKVRQHKRDNPTFY